MRQMLLMTPAAEIPEVLGDGWSQGGYAPCQNVKDQGRESASQFVGYYTA